MACSCVLFGPQGAADRDQGARIVRLRAPGEVDEMPSVNAARAISRSVASPLSSSPRSRVLGLPRRLDHDQAGSRDRARQPGGVTVSPGTG
jgi:hypothetical protein